MIRRSALRAAIVATTVLLSGCVARAPAEMTDARARFTTEIALPPPDTRGSMTLDDAIGRRRSVRAFRDDPLPVDVIGQLLWAAQGITDASGKRAAPSAGALYPLELYVVMPDRVLHYLPAGHRVEVRIGGDHRPALQQAALDQAAVGTAPVVFVVAAVPARTRVKYGDQAASFIDREAGHATENLLLEATSRGLGAVPIGGIDPAAVASELALPLDEVVLGLVPVGYPA